MRRRILALAVPNIITNITVPLVGIADLAIAGRLEDGSSLTAVVIGTTIFNFIYWNFGFLRMGTSGFASQSYGAGDMDETARTLLRSLSVALAISLAILLLQMPIVRFSVFMTRSSEHAESLAVQYFKARIWGAPAVLALYAFKGWFIGMQNPKAAMWMAITVNVVNILVSCLFAFSLGWGIAGVGLGSAVGQWSGVVLALVMLRTKYRALFRHVDGVFRAGPFKRLMTVNRDIFLRTVCLVAVFTYFTVASSTEGDDIVAANALLLQLFTLFSYMMDGFAYAAESLCGRYYGAGDKVMLGRSALGSLEWGVWLSLAVTLLYALFTKDILLLFNPSASVLEAAMRYRWFAVAVPLISFVAFVLDGILVGITASAVMRNVMFMSTAAFFLLYFSLYGLLGNGALWTAFLVYLLLRGLLQFLLSRKMIFPIS